MSRPITTACPTTHFAVSPTAIRLDITGVDDGDWTIRVDRGKVDVGPRKPDDGAAAPIDVTIRMDVATWTDIVAGRVTAPGAVMEGKVAIEGDVMKALALEALL